MKEQPPIGALVYDTREESPVKWRVVGAEDEWLHLSGPIPCRGMKTVDRGEALAFWEVSS